jgi:hypothetical protein
MLEQEIMISLKIVCQWMMTISDRIFTTDNNLINTYGNITKSNKLKYYLTLLYILFILITISDNSLLLV